MTFTTPKELGVPLTDTQGEVKDAEPNVQPEEEDHVGHFTKQEQVAYVLLQCDWKREKAMNVYEVVVVVGGLSHRWYKVRGRQDKIYKTKRAD